MPYTHLALEQRFLIYKLRQAGWSYRQTALTLRRDHATISREIKRVKNETDSEVFLHIPGLSAENRVFWI